MECFGTTDFDNNSRLITLSAIVIGGLHCNILLLKRNSKKLNIFAKNCKYSIKLTHTAHYIKRNNPAMTKTSKSFVIKLNMLHTRCLSLIRQLLCNTVIVSLDSFCLRHSLGRPVWISISN
jgi:hypothetical protein